MEKQLKPKQYYIDLYDRHTVETCCDWLTRPLGPEYMKSAEEKNLDKEEAKRIMIAADKLYIYLLTGDRYIKKEDTIQEWMRRDEVRDSFIETVTVPENITCLTCGRLMFVSSQHFNAGYDDEPDTMLFFYDCPLDHTPRRAFYDNGKEFRYEKQLCPKCQAQLNEDNQTTDEKFITLIICPQCDYTDTIEIERTTTKKEKPDPNYDKDRAKYCLSEEVGKKFIEEKRNMEEFGKLVEKMEEKERNKEIYDKVADLKKLKIIELEELLTPILETAGYIKLQFKNPEITKDVIVPFIVYEQRPDREERASTYDLERLLRKTLKETNWRLMSDGTNYRLGMLEGRLRGYEREEDLLELIKKTKRD